MKILRLYQRPPRDKYISAHISDELFNTIKHLGLIDDGNNYYYYNNQYYYYPEKEKMNALLNILSDHLTEDLWK